MHIYANIWRHSHYGAIHTSELDRSEIDLKVQSDLKVNAQMRTEIDRRSI